MPQLQDVGKPQARIERHENPRRQEVASCVLKPVADSRLIPFGRFQHLLHRIDRPRLDRESSRRDPTQPCRIDVCESLFERESPKRVRFADVRNGCVSVVARKTGKPTIRKLSDAAMKAIKRLPKSPDGTMFKWALPRRRALKMWRAFLDQHGFEGSSKWLRRSGATAVEMKRTGAATVFLGHSAPHLARMHYLDQSQFGMPEGPPALR